MCYNGNAASLIALATNQCGKTDTSVYYVCMIKYCLSVLVNNPLEFTDKDSHKYLLCAFSYVCPLL